MSTPCTSLSPVLHAQAATREPAEINDLLFHPLGPTTRTYCHILREIADKYSVNMKVASHNWLIQFTIGDVQRLFIAYDLGLNSSATARFCDDKAAASTVFSSTSPAIPHIEHRLFLRNGSENISSEMEKYAELHQHNLVCKPKSGSGGEDVFHTTSLQDLAEKVQSIWKKGSDVCLCPFVDLEDEYRLIMLNDQPEIIFRKIRPHLIGDGISTVQQLILAQPSSAKSNDDIAKIIDEIGSQIPEEGKIVHLSWKHNLCSGAIAEFVESPSDSDHSEASRMIRELIQLSKRAAKAVGVVFASVDIAKVKNGPLKVVEINNTVTMDHLMRQHGLKAYLKAKRVYEKAFCQSLGLPFRDQQISTAFASASSADTSACSSQSPSPFKTPSDSPIFGPGTPPNTPPSMQSIDSGQLSCEQLPIPISKRGNSIPLIPRSHLVFSLGSASSSSSPLERNLILHPLRKSISATLNNRGSSNRPDSPPTFVPPPSLMSSLSTATTRVSTPTEFS